MGILLLSFSEQARNIYSPIDYNSILHSSTLFMSRFRCRAIYTTSKRTYTFYYHEKISCLWCSMWIHWPASICFSSILLFRRFRFGIEVKERAPLLMKKKTLLDVNHAKTLCCNHEKFSASHFSYQMFFLKHRVIVT